MQYLVLRPPGHKTPEHTTLAAYPLMIGRAFHKKTTTPIRITRSKNLKMSSIRSRMFFQNITKKTNTVGA